MSMQWAHLKDRPDLLPLLAEWCGLEWAHLYEDWNEDESRREFEASRTDGQLPITLIAVERDELLGTVSILLNDLPGREDLNPWLASLLVLPEHRGRHVATFLIEQAEQCLIEHGHSEAFLFTEAAGGLFQKLGWEPYEPANTNGHAVMIFRKVFEKRTLQG